MPWHPSTLLLCSALAGCAGQSDAPPGTSTLQVEAAPSSRPPSSRDRTDASLAAAIDAASRGQLDDALRDGVKTHPAAAWVDYARLRRDIDTITHAEADRFLAAHADDAVGRVFREDWLAALSRRQEWKPLLAAWRGDIQRESLRCMALNARMYADAADAEWLQSVRRTWLSAKPVSPECAPAIGGWQLRGGLDDDLRRQRIDLAIAAARTDVLREAAEGLPDIERAQMQAYAGALDAGLNDAALAWPRDARSRAVVTAALVAMAKKSPLDGETALAKFAPAFSLDDAQRARVLYEIALQSAASYEPEAARRLAAVPEAAFDERLATLRVREAMARRDWAGAFAAIEKLAPEQRDGAQWRYFAARLIELTGGDAHKARALYAEAAKSPEFHGFLAADRLGATYPLCPWTPRDQPALRRQVEALPALQRAFALYRIGRRDWALQEWNAALETLDDARRRIAVALAQDSGWFDRAVFNLGRDSKDELRLYALRFPLHHLDTIQREAERQRIDPAWIAAEIRAESLFDSKARSPANARGLMQVLPSTGQATAQKAGIPWAGAKTLDDPDANIAIGSAYLREMHDTWGSLPHAIAAYNAGPTPTSRWRTQRPDFDADFWIETISYKETREYVARVLAFSVLYDWRMKGDAIRVSDRIAGKADAPRVRFACPSPAPAPR